MADKYVRHEMSGRSKEPMPKTDKEAFDDFFKENYCELEYKDVRKQFEEVADEGLEYLFEENTDITRLTRKNFIVHMTLDAYGTFEEILEDNIDALNSDISDVVLELGSTNRDAGEITDAYWDTNEELLKKFLRQLYDEKISKMIEEA